MCKLPTSVIRNSHDYKRSRSPWIMMEPKSAYERLMNYLSGGGFRDFGRSARQEEVRLSQSRAWIVVTLLFGIWFLFWLF